jgi:hypothetical protein
MSHPLLPQVRCVQSANAARDARGRPMCCKKHLIGLAISLVPVLASVRQWPLWSGDAVIHLVYAENAAAGHWFQFNIGELSLGTTSVGWTLMMAGAIKALGFQNALIAQKVLLAASVAWTGFVLFMAMPRGDGRLSITAAVAISLWSVLNPGTVYNAPLGMENAAFGAVVAACLLSDLFLPVAVTKSHLRAVLAGTLLGGSCLLRPEGIPVTLIVLLVHLMILMANYRSGELTGKAVARTVLALIACVVVAVTGYGFQYARTGVLLGGASQIARIMTSRLQAVPVISSIVWLDPTLAVRLVAYWPLALLDLVACCMVIRPTHRDATGNSRKMDLQERARSVTCALILLTFTLVYSFLTGAAQVARYIIFLIPIMCFLTRLVLWSMEQSGRGRLALCFLLAASLWMCGVYFLEWHLRLKEPSHRGNYTMQALLSMRETRAANTTALLTALGESVESNQVISVAYVEVQSRFGLDSRVRVVSVDGRVASLEHAMSFNDDGTIDVPSFLHTYRPDYIVETPNYDLQLGTGRIRLHYVPRRNPIAEWWRMPVGNSLVIPEIGVVTRIQRGLALKYF